MTIKFFTFGGNDRQTCARREHDEGQSILGPLIECPFEGGAIDSDAIVIHACDQFEVHLGVVGRTDEIKNKTASLGHVNHFRTRRIHGQRQRSFDRIDSLTIT